MSAIDWGKAFKDTPPPKTDDDAASIVRTIMDSDLNWRRSAMFFREEQHIAGSLQFRVSADRPGELVTKIHQGALDDRRCVDNHCLEKVIGWEHIRASPPLVMRYLWYAGFHNAIRDAQMGG